jgi:hypothetical protein
VAFNQERMWMVLESSDWPQFVGYGEAMQSAATPGDAPIVHFDGPLTLSVAVSQAHAWAAGSWVRALLPYPHVFLAVLFLACAALVVMACECSRSPAGGPPNP